MGCSASSAGGCWFHSGSAVCRVLLSSCTTASPRFRPKTSSARSIVLQFSTINCCSSAGGLPTTISRRWEKYFAACCRWLRNSSIPSITALLMKAVSLCTRRACPDHQAAPAKLQKSNWPNFACSITCRSATWLGKPACALRLAPPRQCSKACCGRSRSEEHTSELQSLTNLVCRLLLEKKNKKNTNHN